MTSEPASILRRTAAGAGWILGWRACARGLGVVSTLVLVRLLAPSDFGLVALASGFWQAIDALSSLGIEEAMIREKTPTRALYDTGFTINALRGVLTVAIVVSSAWPFAWFFNEPRLVPVLLSLTVVAVANACENIGIVDFRRDLDFRKEFVMFVIPRVVSTVATILAAVMWHSHWALVVGIVLSSVLRLIGGYLLHPYRPRLSLAAWREIASFSFWSWALSVTTLLRDRVDNFVIGRMLGLTSVGIYSVGSEIAALPTTELVAPLGRACFSAFAAARNAGSDTAGTYLRLTGVAALISLPAGIGLSLVADPVVKLAFGDRWTTAAGLIEILGVTSIAAVFGTLSAVLLTAHALLKPQMWVQLMVICLRVAAMAAMAARFGLTGAAVGMSLSLIVENLGYTALALHHLGLRPGPLLARLWRSALATLGMAAALWWLGLGWAAVGGSDLAVALALAKAMAIGIVVYSGLVLLIWGVMGRPDGPERDVLTLIERTALGRRVLGRSALPGLG